MNKNRFMFFKCLLVLGCVVLVMFSFGSWIQGNKFTDNQLTITSSIPTRHIFEYVENCMASTNSGYIIYRQNNSLYIANGEGCFSKLIFDMAISVPAWSPNGQKIAIQCEQNGEICILDAHFLPSYCFGKVNDKCKASIDTKLEFCKQADNCRVDAISWSPDMDKLAIAYRYGIKKLSSKATTKGAICILSLENNQCKKIYEAGDNAEPLWVDWSPLDNRLILSNMKGELFLLKEDGTDKSNLTVGIYPSWSPDGKNISFYKPSDDPDKEYFGIAQIDSDGTNLKWLYSPSVLDRHAGYGGNNIGVGCDPKRGMSWSSDKKYIIFPASYNSMFDCQLMRLDLEKNEAIFLTKNNANQPPTYYYDPDWKP
jgi:dipeptidyl aminopeptidase/acylaminoacyl peptidase